MRKLPLVLMVVSLWAPAMVRAADPGSQQVLQEIGAILGWRLGPEAVEEWCRTPDPQGMKVRRQALEQWLAKNDARIKAVDSRVAEVVPLLQPPDVKGDPVEAVRAQVKSMVIESIFGGKNPEETRAICKSEADPHSPRWNSNGMPFIEQSLAALYDWQTEQAKK